MMYVTKKTKTMMDYTPVQYSCALLKSNPSRVLTYRFPTVSFSSLAML